MGKFVVFEGGDKVGKTTVLSNLKDELSNVYFTREPGADNPLCKELRKLLLDFDYTPDPLTELLLFQADRVEHQRKIIFPKLEEMHVFTDRYWHSTLVYQVASKSSLSIPQYESIHNELDLIEPDVFVLFETDGSLEGKDNNRLDKDFEGDKDSITERYRKLFDVYEQDDNIVALKYIVTADNIDSIHKDIINDLDLEE